MPIAFSPRITRMNRSGYKRVVLALKIRIFAFRLHAGRTNAPRTYRCPANKSFKSQISDLKVQTCDPLKTENSRCAPSPTFPPTAGPQRPPHASARPSLSRGPNHHPAIHRSHPVAGLRPSHTPRPQVSLSRGPDHQSQVRVCEAPADHTTLQLYP